MMNQKKMKRVIDIIFLALILVFVALFIKTINNDEAGIGLLAGYFSIIVITISCYIGIRLAMKKHHNEKLDKIDFEKYKNYYRDILEEYSPAVLNYIDNFSIDKNVIIATLMKLELKGTIDSNLQINKEKCLELDENEKYICWHIKDRNNIDFAELEKRVLQDCKKYKFLKIKKAKKFNLDKLMKKIIGPAIVFFIIFPFILGLMGVKNTLLLNSFGALAFGFPIMSFVVIIAFGVSYREANNVNPYTRSKKGKQINEKLEGLKNYLKDYSSLDDKTKQELVLWEDYLIYSVIFNQNEKIVKEYEDKIGK